MPHRTPVASNPRAVGVSAGRGWGGGISVAKARRAADAPTTPHDDATTRRAHERDSMDREGGRGGGKVTGRRECEWQTRSVCVWRGRLATVTQRRDHVRARQGQSVRDERTFHELSSTHHACMVLNTSSSLSLLVLWWTCPVRRRPRRALTSQAAGAC